MFGKALVIASLVLLPSVASANLPAWTCSCRSIGQGMTNVVAGKGSNGLFVHINKSSEAVSDHLRPTEHQREIGRTFFMLLVVVPLLAYAFSKRWRCRRAGGGSINGVSPNGDNGHH